MEIGISAFSLFAGSFLIWSLVYTGSMIAVCDSFHLCTGLPLASDFTIFGVLFWLAFCFGVLSLLDENCDPGWGDRGRPLWLLLGVFCQRW